ncbi:AAA family ATPase [Methylobacterium sp. B1]|uniref:AAA family ATPase n=1 Tax=Methylobacterium sp. B1 TaxID=91459 RepID=UPI000349E03C|nr:AAA family ATPase [Methylobacterium sp. B1]
MLVILSGLPGTGKTTIGKLLAAKRSGTYVRMDEIEHALSRATGLGHDIGPAGYIVAFAIAASNLKLGTLLIADSVNPVLESRQGWRDVARGAAVRFVEVEVVCSDEREHEHRVVSRTTDIAGFTPPTWSSVKAHDYAPWISPRLVVDTALLSPEAALAEVEAVIDTISAV